MTNKEEFIIGTKSKGLGDVLLLTSVCKHIKNKKIIVNLLPCCDKFKFLFDNIADEVILTENPIETPNIGHGHFAQRKCRSINYYGNDFIPHIEFNNNKYQSEIEKTLSNLKNPVILKLNCSKTWKHLREFSLNYWLNYFSNKNYDFIQFELSENFLPYPNAIHFIDEPLEKQTAYYKSIKKYIGVDTGDLHLMLSLGGKVEAHVPRSNIEYNHDDWHYKTDNINYIIN